MGGFVPAGHFHVSLKFNRVTKGAIHRLLLAEIQGRIAKRVLYRARVYNGENDGGGFQFIIWFG